MACAIYVAWNDIGPHHRFATGTLYDTVSGGLLSVEDRGSSGTGHGWSGANVVYWNCISRQSLNNYASAMARIKVEAAPTTCALLVAARVDYPILF